MEFIFLGIPFRFSKEIWTRQKFKQTSAVLWAAVWRLILLYTALEIVSFIAVFALVYSFDLQDNVQIVLFRNLVLAQQIVRFVIEGLVCYVIVHRAIIRKTYKTFSREFLDGKSPKMFSRRYLRTVLTIGIINLPICALMTSLPIFEGYIPTQFAIFVGISVSIVEFAFFHATLQGGSWGFTLHAKSNS